MDIEVAKLFELLGRATAEASLLRRAIAEAKQTIAKQQARIAELEAAQGDSKAKH